VINIHIHFCHFQVKIICRRVLTPSVLMQYIACFLKTDHDSSHTCICSPTYVCFWQTILLEKKKSEFCQLILWTLPMNSEELMANINFTKQCYSALLSTCQLILPHSFLGPTNSIWISTLGETSDGQKESFKWRSRLSVCLSDNQYRCLNRHKGLFFFILFQYGMSSLNCVGQSTS